MKCIILAFAATFGFMTAAGGASAQDLTGARCGALADRTFGRVTVMTTNYGEVDGTAICQVAATRAPFLDIEVVLPVDWSGRYFQQGGGGFDGVIPAALLSDNSGTVTGLGEPVARHGAVYAASNGGHRARVAGEAGPDIWLDGSETGQESLRDYAYHAILTTNDFARALIEDVYGRAPDHAYFNGCSNGGRNAYVMAERRGEQFDGIVAGCEPINIAGQTSAWVRISGIAALGESVTPEQFKYLWDRTVDACDGLDGIEDGIIAQPMTCKVDPDWASCDAQSGECLSDEQVERLRTNLFGDIARADGEVLYSGFGPTNLSSSFSLVDYLGGPYAIIATGDHAWAQLDHRAAWRLEVDFDRIANGLSRLGVSHDRIAIADYVAGGGKLISWHAGDDNLLSFPDHVRNFLDVQALANDLSANGAAGDDQMVFYTVPGAVHGQGSTLSEIDWATAIIGWVENGADPGALSFARGDVTLPVCAWPEMARAERGVYVCGS